MNWITETYGANLIDYVGDEDRVRKVLAVAREAVETAFSSKLLFSGQHCIADRFRLPVPTNPINTVGWSLGNTLYRCWLRQ